MRIDYIDKKFGDSNAIQFVEGLVPLQKSLPSVSISTKLLMMLHNCNKYTWKVQGRRWEVQFYLGCLRSISCHGIHKILSKQQSLMKNKA